MKLCYTQFLQRKGSARSWRGEKGGGIDGEANGPGSEVSMLVDNCKVLFPYFKSINFDVLSKLDNKSDPLDVILKNLPSFSIISRSLSHLR